MGLLQKFALAATGLGALYLVVSNPRGVAALASGTQKVIGGTVTQIATGGKGA